MIVNDQELLVSLAQLQELALALASVKQTASSQVAFHVQVASIQKEILRIRHEMDIYLGVADWPVSENTVSG